MNLWCCVFRHLAATRFGRKNNPASCCPAVAPKLKTLLMAIFFQLLFFAFFLYFCMFSVCTSPAQQEFAPCVTKYC